MTTKKAKKSSEGSEGSANQQPSEFLILGHLIKYNLYVLAKSIVFTSVYRRVETVDEAIKLVNQAMDGIDLESKKNTGN
jgi:hypothetical protein